MSSVLKIIAKFHYNLYKLCCQFHLFHIYMLRNRVTDAILQFKIIIIMFSQPSNKFMK